MRGLDPLVVHGVLFVVIASAVITIRVLTIRRYDRKRAASGRY
ncbi:hypothetical protein [Streptomyces marispadix]|nr:hypothetical protein [Streptomyces marispadix]